MNRRIKEIILTKKTGEDSEISIDEFLHEIIALGGLAVEIEALAYDLVTMSERGKMEKDFFNDLPKMVELMKKGSTEKAREKYLHHEKIFKSSVPATDENISVTDENMLN
jgi:hypothetical protein